MTRIAALLELRQDLSKSIRTRVVNAMDNINVYTVDDLELWVANKGIAGLRRLPFLGKQGVAVLRELLP